MSENGPVSTQDMELLRVGTIDTARIFHAAMLAGQAFPNLTAEQLAEQAFAHAHAFWEAAGRIKIEVSDGE